MNLSRFIKVQKQFDSGNFKINYKGWFKLNIGMNFENGKNKQIFGWILNERGVFTSYDWF